MNPLTECQQSSLNTNATSDQHRRVRCPEVQSHIRGDAELFSRFRSPTTPRIQFKCNAVWVLVQYTHGSPEITTPKDEASCSDEASKQGARRAAGSWPNGPSHHAAAAAAAAADADADAATGPVQYMMATVWMGSSETPITAVSGAVSSCKRSRQCLHPDLWALVRYEVCTVQCLPSLKSDLRRSSKHRASRTRLHIFSDRLISGRGTC